MTLDPNGDDEATKRFVTMVPGERIDQAALRQIEYAGQRGDSFYDKLTVAAEDGTLTPLDARIAVKRIDTIEKLQAAIDDQPAQIIQKDLAATGYKNALEQSEDKRKFDKLDNIEELIADAQPFALDQRSQATDGEPYNDEIAHGFVKQCEEIRAAVHEQQQNGHCATLFAPGEPPLLLTHALLPQLPPRLSQRTRARAPEGVADREPAHKRQRAAVGLPAGETERHPPAAGREEPSPATTPRRG